MTLQMMVGQGGMGRPDTITMQTSGCKRCIDADPNDWGGFGKCNLTTPLRGHRRVGPMLVKKSESAKTQKALDKARGQVKAKNRELDKVRRQVKALKDKMTLLQSEKLAKPTADAGRGPQLQSLLAACRKLHAFTVGENTDKAGTIAKLKDQLDVLKRKSKGEEDPQVASALKVTAEVKKREAGIMAQVKQVADARKEQKKKDKAKPGKDARQQLVASEEELSKVKQQPVASKEKHVPSMSTVSDDAPLSDINARRKEHSGERLQSLSLQEMDKVDENVCKIEDPF